MAAVFGMGSPALGDKHLPGLGDSMLEVSISAAEKATGREFIRQARSHFQFVDDPLVLEALQLRASRVASGGVLVVRGGAPRRTRFARV